MSEMHEERPKVSLNRYGPAAGLLGLIGGGVMLFGVFSNNVQAWQAYLFGYIVWLSLSLGCLGLLLLMHMLNASWGLPVLRVMEAATSKKNFGLLVLLFLPLLYTVLTGNGVLYPWANPETVHVLDSVDSGGVRKLRFAPDDWSKGPCLSQAESTELVPVRPGGNPRPVVGNYRRSRHGLDVLYAAFHDIFACRPSKREMRRPSRYPIRSFQWKAAIGIGAWFGASPAYLALLDSANPG